MGQGCNPKPAPKLAPTAEVDPASLATGLLSGDRRALARAITLVESTKPEHRDYAEALLAEILPQAGKAFRIGISGAPGAGKSTFIEAFGEFLTGEGRKVAVLAVDPSSLVSGGSILGDKTRMPKLAANPSAFIRPSPGGRSLGGIARRTREAILLVEAAGFDTVLVETIGVGQAEVAVAELVDMFLLMLAPASGDELQGLKRGIVEIADLVVVTKADGELLPAARRAAAEYGNALGFLRPKTSLWKASVALVSSLRGEGISEVWAVASHFRAKLTTAGVLDQRRAEQARAALWREISECFGDMLRDHPAVMKVLPGIETEVMAGRRSPTSAARDILARFMGAAGGG